MDNIDSMINDINDQVTRLRNTIIDLIKNAKTTEELENVAKIIDSLKDNPNLGHIAPEMENIKNERIE